MSSKQNVLISFKNNLLVFLDELIETFPSYKDFIILRIFVKDKIPIDLIMNSFIEDLQNIKIQVLNKDSKFFTEGNPIFSKLEKEEVFKDIWSNMNTDNKNIMWNWFEQFIKFAEKYKSL